MVACRGLYLHINSVSPAEAAAPLTEEEMGGAKFIKMGSILVFLGWLMVWVLLPTEVFKYSWTPRLRTKLNSTYFREQGVNLLLFSFPIMFMAAFGCVYLHLKNKKDDQHSKRNLKSYSPAILSRPVLVMAPFGIINMIEAAFLLMFVALLIWSLANYLQVSFSNLHMHGKPVKLWQTKFRSVSLRLGYVGNICWSFLFFPVTRGSSILPLFGLTSESSIKYHIWLGHISNTLFSLHTLGFVIFWAMTDQMAELIEWSKVYVPNVSGVIAIAIGMIMWATSFRPVRRRMFELFFYSHQLYALYIIFYMIHVGVAYVCMILPGIFLFVIDRYLRFLQSQRRARLVSARLLPSGTVELNFSKTPGLIYNPTSVLFVNIPSISKLQWHPFTITSNSSMEKENLSVVIKREGSWTSKLYQTLSSSSSNNHLQVSVEGPYGPTSSDFLRHESLLMICGGSGITPVISIIREIIVQSTKPDHQVPSVRLVCAFRNSNDLPMLDLLLPLSNSHSDISKLNIQIEAFITREKEGLHLNDQNHIINTISLKPHPLDRPISPTLGTNNWLWLCTIISSSFFMFLLFLGIVTRFYIYPIEQNKIVYNFTYKVIWDMFLACACICIVSSLVFLWCKKINALNSNPQVSSITSPETLPYSCINGAERELESFPTQSIVKSTKVHYGSRPDLKKILLGCRENDVGVIVCGPGEMRYEVARICSSGSAGNLRFESMSFNW